MATRRIKPLPFRSISAARERNRWPSCLKLLLVANLGPLFFPHLVLMLEKRFVHLAHVMKESFSVIVLEAKLVRVRLHGQPGNGAFRHSRLPTRVQIKECAEIEIQPYPQFRRIPNLFWQLLPVSKRLLDDFRFGRALL